MGKIVTNYLSDQEARDLKEFCEENRCTQYSALKTAVKQLLFKPLQWKEEDIPEGSQEEKSGSDEIAEHPNEDRMPEPDPLASILRKLIKTRDS